MKILKLIITLGFFSTLTLVGCKDHQSNEDHGHAHGPNGEHIEEVEATNQEEFNVNDASEIKTAEANSEEQNNSATIVVKANKALEYKFKINQFDKLEYEWTSNAPLHYDFHGDPDAKKDYPQGYFESYAIGHSNHAKGKVTIPYMGSHGWYWKNKSDKDITITLTTKGKYDIVGLIQ